MLNFRLRIRTFQHYEVLKLVADTSTRHQNSQNSSDIAYNLCGETDEYDHSQKQTEKLWRVPWRNDARRSGR